VEYKKSETLAHHRAGMEHAVPWSASMLRALERDGFTLTHVRNPSGPSWFVRVIPPVWLQEGFGLAPEVLLIVVGGEVQARALTEAQAEVVRSGLRLDGNLVVVADEGATPLVGRLHRIGGHGQRIAWVRDEVGAWPPLADVLRATLPTFDVFEERDAVRGAQLVGRDAEVTELRTRVVRGDAVGLFGLRKMGKTSVMRAVTDWFDPASAMRDAVVTEAGAGIGVVIDAGVLIDRTVEELANELLEALRRRQRAAGETPPPRAAGLSGWKAAVEPLLDAGHRLSVVIDEYDLLFEGESGEGPIAGVGRLFRLLRGWAQTRQGQVSLVLVGRDPSFLAAPEIDGVTNALAGWYTPMWLGPLPAPKATELLRKLGRRVGLEVGHESAALAREWTGGHPLLQRQFGSALRRATRERDTTWGAPTDPHAALAPARFREREAVLEVMREVVALLHKRYPTALDVLALLAHGDRWDDAVDQCGGDEGEAARMLRNFGLVNAAHTISAGLAWYLRDAAPVTSTLRRAG
jgi:hypothetical protein